MNVVFAENCLKILGVDPPLATFRVNRAVCIRMSPKKASQYLGSLNTFDAHFEEPTYVLLVQNNGIFTH